MKRPIWKVKRGGKLIGSFHFTAPGGARINTHTDDAGKAFKFRERWLREKAHSQKTDVEGAAEATIAALDATPALETPTSEAPPPDPLPAAAPAAPAVQPDGYIPPPAGNPGDWAADAARAAAGGTAATAATAPDPENDPQFLKDLLDDAATMAVVLQIKLQEWLIAEGAQLKAAVVPNDNRGRAKGKEIWLKQFLLWAPDDFDLPGYLAAPIAVAVATLPVQIGEGCTPLPKKEKKKPDEQPAAEMGGASVVP